MDMIKQLLPDSIQSIINETPPSLIHKLEEIRIRVNRPLELIVEGKPYYPIKNNQRHIVTMAESVHFMNKLSNFSLYAFEEELKRGYITIRGGHRVGLAGKVTIELKQLKRLVRTIFELLAKKLES